MQYICKPNKSKRRWFCIIIFFAILYSYYAYLYKVLNKDPLQFYGHPSPTDVKNSISSSMSSLNNALPLVDTSHTESLNEKIVQPSHSTFPIVDKLHTKNLNRRITAEKRFIAESKTAMQKDPESYKRLRSPFYGMKHRETYGQPLSFFGKKSFEIKYENWKNYFPDMFASLEKYKSKNPEANSNFFTTNFSIIINKTDLTFDDEFTATIISVDGEGKAKTFGGDYYRARLIKSNIEYPDGISCKIVDNADGSYTAKAPILLEGQLTLEVTLVLSIEGIDQYIKKIDRSTSWDRQFVSRLESNESVYCNVNLSDFSRLKTLPKCDYSNPRNGEPWFCVRPPSGVCSKVIYTAKYEEAQETAVNAKAICQKFKCNKKHRLNFNIKTTSNANSAKRKTALSMCKHRFPDMYTEKNISGFIQDGIWKSIDCINNYTSIQHTSKCFQNKVIYLIGDSTVRHLYYQATEFLNLNSIEPGNPGVWQRPKVAYRNEKDLLNVTIYYRAHGYPFQNFGPPDVRPYISDLIEDIAIGGKDVYVFFNIGAHLYLYNPSIYLHRLRGIKQSIINHHKTFPETKFFVRGQNVLEWKDIDKMNRFSIAFQWNIHVFEQLWYESFKKMKNVMFLNMWDISTIWPCIDDYHPKPKVLSQQGLYFYRFICSSV